jgi:hypothetical protein
MTKLINDFHHTSMIIRGEWDDQEDTWFYITGQWACYRDKSARRKMLQIAKTLCGIEGCECGIVRKTEVLD